MSAGAELHAAVYGDAPIALQFNGDADSNTLILNAGTFTVNDDTQFDNQSLTINVRRGCGRSKTK